MYLLRTTQEMDDNNRKQTDSKKRVIVSPPAAAQSIGWDNAPPRLLNLFLNFFGGTTRLFESPLR